MANKLKQKIQTYIINHFWDGKNSLIRLLAEDNYLQSKGRFFVKKFFNSRLFYLLFIQSISLSETANPEIKTLLTNFFDNKYAHLSEELKIVYLHLLIDCKLGDCSVVEKLLCIAEQTKNKATKYWLTLSIDKILFWNGFDCPQDYYKRRRNLFKEICNLYNLNLNNKKDKVNEKKKKLLFITYLLDDNLRNSVQRVLTMFTNNVDYSKFNVSVLCLDVFCSVLDYNVSNFGIYKNSKHKKHKTRKLLNGKVKLNYINSLTIKSKLKKALRKIEQINPDIIYDLSDETSVASYVYSKAFTTIYEPIRSHSFTSFHKYMIAAKPENVLQQHNFYGYPIEELKFIQWSFPEFKMETEERYKREDYNLGKDDFIMITVGNIPVEDYSFYDMIIKLLEKNQHFCWIIVGAQIPEYLKKYGNSLIEKRRIIDWGYENKLTALYQMCDIFVNPNRTGSSGAIAIAAQQNLPIALTKFSCDAMRWIHEENCVANTYEELKNEIIKLSSNEDYYEDKSKLFKQLVDDICESDKIWKNWNNLLENLE